MKNYLICILLIFSSLYAVSQDKKKEEKKSEEDPLKKAEAAFDKAFDGLFKTKKKEESTTKTESSKEKSATKESKEEKSSGGFGGFSFGGKPKASYGFVSSMTMKIDMKSAKEKSNNVMRTKYYFGADDKAVGVKFLSSSNADMQKAQANMDMFLMDFEQNKFFTFTNNNGTKNVMAIGFKPDKFEDYVTQEEDQIKITKTSETKNIVGYICDGYRIEDKDSKDQVLMWISQKRVGEFAKMGQKMGMNSGMMGKNSSKNYMAYTAHSELNKLMLQGRAVLGYTIKSDKGDQTEMEVEEIKLNDSFSFKTSDYKTLFGN